MSTIESILKYGTKLLKGVNLPSPRLDAEVILSHLLQVPRINLLIDKDKQVDEEVAVAFYSQLERRIKGEPVAYIIGHKEFMGLDFLVDENVLIPRPDTEVLVEYVLSKCSQKKSLKIVDIGTGSGAVGLSIANYRENTSLFLVDISDGALRLAKKNAERLQVKSSIEYVLSDCFDSIKPQKFDVIVSNPPYIPTEEIAHLQVEVSRYEPSTALDGGADGLKFYRRIICEGKSFLKKGGLIAFEIGHDQAEDVMHMLQCNGYRDIEKIKDYAGLDRVIGARM